MISSEPFLADTLRACFETYERDHAPRLRAEGLARFPVESGIRYSRSLGEIVGGRT